MWGQRSWRPSPFETCSSTPPTSTRFCAILASRTFRTAVERTDPRSNPKVKSTSPLFNLKCCFSSAQMGVSCLKKCVFTAGFETQATYFLPRAEPLRAFVFASVRITHMVQVLGKRAATCAHMLFPLRACLVPIFCVNTGEK